MVAGSHSNKVQENKVGRVNKQPANPSIQVNPSGCKGGQRCCLCYFNWCWKQIAQRWWGRVTCATSWRWHPVLKLEDQTVNTSKHKQPTTVLSLQIRSLHWLPSGVQSNLLTRQGCAREKKEAQGDFRVLGWSSGGGGGWLLKLVGWVILFF